MFERVHNFRDVGKHVNQLMRASGIASPVLKEGLFYRSARPDSATERDLSTLMEEISLRSIIDLRGKGELPPASKRILLDDHFATHILRTSRSKHHHHSVRHVLPPKLVYLNPRPEPLQENRSRPDSRGHHERVRYRIDFTGYSFFLMANWMVRAASLVLYMLGFKVTAARLLVTTAINPGGLKGLYVNFVERCQPGIRDSLRLLSEPPNLPAMVHCSQGKDRTGLVVAFLLHSLGVPEHIILQDYKISQRELEHEAPSLLAEMERVGMSHDFMESPPETLRATFEYLKDRYGSIDAFLDHVGFDGHRRSTLRQNFLASGR